MSYAIRNTIILAVLLVLVLAAGIGYIFLYQDKRIDKLRADHAALQGQLGDPEKILTRLIGVQEKVDALNTAWAARPKTLPSEEIASRTNMYLNDILSLSPEMDLNVLTNEQVEQGPCGYTRYHLAGQGAFPSFARLVQFLEFGPRLMKLVNVDVREVHSVNDELGRIDHTVQFDADLLAYYSSLPAFADSIRFSQPASTVFAPIGHDPFTSLVVPEIPPNTFNLPNVERSTLLAIMKGRAFISDQSNQLVMLGEGDEVYLGYVARIMPERHQVLFMLNKGGLVERYMLTLAMESTRLKGSKRK
jgi:hypothetical protein